MEGDGDQGAGMAWAPPIGSTSDAYSSRYPMKVDVAFDVLRWASGIENHPLHQQAGRELKAKENSVYEAGLEVLRLYLTGEMDFADEPKPMVQSSVPVAVSPVNIETPS